MMSVACTYKHIIFPLLLSDFDPWKWKYFAGNRYLADNNVVSLVSSGSIGAVSNHENDEHVAMIAITPMGISIVEVQKWTLHDKAHAYLVYQPRHEKKGLIYDLNIYFYGDPSDSNIRVGDNDGLWTSMHAMGEAFACAIDKDVQSCKRAWQAFEGLETLSNVTGSYPQFVARSYCYGPDDIDGCGDADGSDRWHQSSTMSGYLWKDDTSSDEIDGHLAVYPLIYDLVAQTDGERQRVYSMIDGLTGSIVENDLYLIDPTTGNHTTWGFWNPKELNEDPVRVSERPTNSLGILAYLASAYSITRKDEYRSQYMDLVNNHQYVRNCMQTKIDNPDDDNHSDNELLSLSYHTLFYSWYRLPEGDFKEELRVMIEPMIPGAVRMWGLIGAEFNPLWTSIFLGLMELKGDRVTPEQIFRSVHALRRQALDLIDWPVDHTLRADVVLTPNHVRDNDDKPVIKEILPPDARPTAHFNTDIFVVRIGDPFI